MVADNRGWLTHRHLFVDQLAHLSSVTVSHGRILQGQIMLGWMSVTTH